MVVAQPADDGPALDLLHGVFLKEEAAPYTVLYIESAAGDGRMKVLSRHSDMAKAFAYLLKQ